MGTDWNKNFKDLRNTLVTREHQNLYDVLLEKTI